MDGYAETPEAQTRAELSRNQIQRETRFAVFRCSPFPPPFQHEQKGSIDPTLPRHSGIIIVEAQFVAVPTTISDDEQVAS